MINWVDLKVLKGRKKGRRVWKKKDWRSIIILYMLKIYIFRNSQCANKLNISQMLKQLSLKTRYPRQSQWKCFRIIMEGSMFLLGNIESQLLIMRSLGEKQSNKIKECNLIESKIYKINNIVAWFLSI